MGGIGLSTMNLLDGGGKSGGKLANLKGFCSSDLKVGKSKEKSNGGSPYRERVGKVAVEVWSWDVSILIWVDGDLKMLVGR